MRIKGCCNVCAYGKHQLGPCFYDDKLEVKSDQLRIFKVAMEEDSYKDRVIQIFFLAEIDSFTQFIFDGNKGTNY